MTGKLEAAIKSVIKAYDNPQKNNITAKWDDLVLNVKQLNIGGDLCGKTCEEYEVAAIKKFNAEINEWRKAQYEARLLKSIANLVDVYTEEVSS